jgi:large subunit ribosomal protein L18
MARGNKAVARLKRHHRVRGRVFGTADRPRLSVCRSLRHIRAQVIDDERGHTLVAASTLDPELREKLVGLSKTDMSKMVGQLVAERAHQRGVEKVVFDRGGYRYHGRVKALAEGARSGGLQF